MAPHPHKIELFRSRFEHLAVRVFAGRAQLFPDRIEFSGWTFGHRYQCRIPLDGIVAIDWSPEAKTGANATFTLKDGQTVAVRLHEVAEWQRVLDERMRWSAPGQFLMRSDQRRLDLPMQDLVAYASSMA